ncbi:hypothetical protein WJX72_006211 [[Myrmecia] bisecta]|uniref:AP2/ERF domain-containing protein n=1 Tax=[Myrmecia] bisecta TaxID=41462 RepID=A0AAW1PXP6_9CHLO
MMITYQQRHIGHRYVTAEAAAYAYDRASIAVYGRDGVWYLNFPMETYGSDDRERRGEDLEQWVKKLAKDVNPAIPGVPGSGAPELVVRARKLPDHFRKPSQKLPAEELHARRVARGNKLGKSQPRRCGECTACRLVVHRTRKPCKWILEQRAKGRAAKAAAAEAQGTRPKRTPRAAEKAAAAARAAAQRSAQRAASARLRRAKKLEEELQRQADAEEALAAAERPDHGVVHHNGGDPAWNVPPFLHEPPDYQAFMEKAARCGANREYFVFPTGGGENVREHVAVCGLCKAAGHRQNICAVLDYYEEGGAAPVGAPSTPSAMLHGSEQVVEPGQWAEEIKPCQKEVLQAVQNIANGALQQRADALLIGSMSPAALLAFGVIAEEIMAAQLGSRLALHGGSRTDPSPSVGSAP